MSSRFDAIEVRDLLRAAFRARLQPAGWEILETEGNRHRLLAFRCPVAEHFAATGEVGQASSLPDRPPVLVTNVFVGVSYEPLRKLSPLLDLYEVSVLHEHAWPEISGDEDDDENSEAPLEIKTAEDADHAAERLASLIIERALAFAERHASLEVLLEEFSDGDEGRPHLTYPALLAAAGRFDEARESLALLEVSQRSELTRSTRRATRQLKRWVDSGGDCSLIPASPPPLRFSARAPTSFSRLWSESWAKSRAQRAALNEVRERARGKSREEARAMLSEALTRHGAHKQSPLWIESGLDRLWDSREDRVQLGIKVLKGAARFGLGVAKAIRDRELPDPSVPDWLEPPDHALYEVPRSDQWIAAELDPDADAWLDRAHQAAPHPFGIAMLSAWLRRRGDVTDTTDALDIYVGDQRVGTVPAEAAVAYAGVMADAAARDEYPCLEAHLARRGSRHVLELAKPPR
jgi:hypothetical protein